MIFIKTFYKSPSSEGNALKFLGVWLSKATIMNRNLIYAAEFGVLNYSGGRTFEDKECDEVISKGQLFHDKMRNNNSCIFLEGTA